MQNDQIETARELATHASDIKHLQTDVDKMVNDIDEIKKSLEQISKTLSEAQGGWRVFLALGTAASLVGSTLGWLYQHWSR